VHIGVYRIVQEAVTNIMKHASATQVHIQLSCKNDRKKKKEKKTYSLYLTIEDNGRGFSPEQLSSSRFGLTNMQQRARAIHAQLEIETRIDQGTAIHVAWQEREDEEANG
jgi:signal transduction histidine kinase